MENFITVNGDCYEWNGSMFQSGYGRLKIEGKSHRVHRLSWQFAYGPIPDGMYVMHICDNRRCVRLSHLRLGTHAENMVDMVEKGRSLARARNPRAKLTDEQVSEIRRLYDEGWTQARLGQRYGVDQTQVSYILRRDGGAPGKGTRNRKLSDEQVAEIRRRYDAGGTSQTMLAKEFGVSPALVSHIITGKMRT